MALQRRLDLDRVVIVQPSFYGTDNAATLDGPRQLGPQRARGVAVIDDKTSRETLDAMAAAGMRGVRLNLETAGEADPAAAARKLGAAVAQIAGRGWHLQVHTRIAVIAALADALDALPVPLVVDHFGGAKAALGPEQPGFAALVALLGSGKAYLKISGAYRISTRPPIAPTRRRWHGRSSPPIPSGFSGAAIGRTPAPRARPADRPPISALSS